MSQGGQKKVSLMWKDHDETVKKKIYFSIFEIPYDCELLTADHRILDAHSFILSSVSPFFKRIFETPSSKEHLIALDGVEANDLQDILYYMIHGVLEIEENRIESIAKIAQKFEIPLSLNGEGETMLTTSIQQKPCANGDNLGISNIIQPEQQESFDYEIIQTLQNQSLFNVEQMEITFDQLHQNEELILPSLEDAMEQVEEYPLNNCEIIEHAEIAQESHNDQMISIRKVGRSVIGSSSKQSETKDVKPYTKSERKSKIIESVMTESDIEFDVDNNTRFMSSNSGNDAKLNCQYCHRSFQNLKLLKGHEKYDCRQNVNRIVYTCEICSKTFPRPGKLRQHNISSHNDSAVI